MEFTAYLETSKEYESSDVVVAFHKVLERGLYAMQDNDEKFHAEIISDLINNSPIIERDME
jgi:hypothetical protein